MKSPRERADEKRAERLEEIEEQKRDGRLVVRKMTDEERERYPKREPGDEPRRGRRRI